MQSVSVRIFLYHWVRPSVSVFFLGVKYVCPSYRPLKFLKSANSGQKSVRSFTKKLRNPYLPQNVKKSLNYKRCNIYIYIYILLVPSCKHSFWIGFPCILK